MTAGSANSFPKRDISRRIAIGPVIFLMHYTDLATTNGNSWKVTYRLLNGSPATASGLENANPSRNSFNLSVKADFQQCTLNYLICQAGIGRHAGRPTLVKLHQQCLTSGIIQHELLHALGFLHEHSRPDRDEHISIVEDNMRPEVSKTNYQKMSKMATFGLPYDAESIMHYGLEVSKSPDKPAIVFKRSPPPRWMGQQYGLSPLDVAKIRAAYNCSKLTFKDVPSVANQDACATCAQNAGNEESEDFVVDERALAFVFPMPSMNTLPFTKEQCERQFSSVCNISLLHNEIGRSPLRCDPSRPYYAVKCYTATATTAALQATFRRMAQPPVRIIQLLLQDSLHLRGATLQPIRLQVIELALDECHTNRMTGKLRGMALSNLLAFQARKCTRGLAIRRLDFSTSHKLRVIEFWQCVIQSVEVDSFFYLLDLRALTLELGASPAEVKKQHCDPRFAWYRHWLSGNSYLIKEREWGSLYNTSHEMYRGLWSQRFEPHKLYQVNATCG
ncbi:uncharacterized protein LOC129590980 isoform X2 [Paramacrobiotus metropolitanus]|uniref:uncharacterized protein LOC129590980 isoform X2 n=1 Tax=Paramacrobiotus metropolitanus TaxID=2943436 RepID=UPI002445BC02|nr:uncharacterized protein LOC129590980 isoform X2 [Paramacrobiotus metropolitanus]